MAKEKKRGFLSWLGLGPKEEPQQAEPEQQIEPQPEEQIQQQAVVEQEIEKEVEAEAKAEPAPHSEAESEAFAADVVEVTEQVVAREEVAETAPEAVIEEPAAPQEAPLHAQPPVYLAEEALPQAEEVAPIEPEAEEWLTEDDQRELTDEELEAAALSAPAEEEIVLEEEPVEVAPLEQEKPTKEGFFARLKRSLLKTKENLGSGFISLFRGKKSMMICSRSWKSSCWWRTLALRRRVKLSPR